MKTMFVTAASILALTSGALAADLPVITKAPPPVASAWDIAFGGLIASDYNFRGVSQSDRGPSVGAYFEPRFNITPNVQLYAGIGGYSVKLASDPAAEIDLYAGIRPTFGPLALDIGFLYYWYPRESQLFIDPTGTFLTTSPVGATGFWSLNDTDFWEIYGKATYTISDYVAVGGALYYAESWLNSGADGTFASANIKFTAPAGFLPSDMGAYVSAEVGHYWLAPRPPSRRPSMCRITSPGTPASASSTRCSPSTCATTTPISRRPNARWSGAIRPPSTTAAPRAGATRPSSPSSPSTSRWRV